MGSLEEVLAEQLEANRSSSALWDGFKDHRAHLTELCARDVALGSGQTLCVLGAGNANDLDLEALAARYRSITLVDLDIAALERAMARQTAATRSRLLCRAPVDVSGMLGRLTRWKASRVTPDELAELPGLAARELAARLGGTFDVVLSACLLTQMQLGLLTVLGEDHRLFEAARFTLTLGHLRTLSELAAPGGRVLMASDLTSTDLAPAILSTPPHELGALAEQLTREGRIFQVANPALWREMVKDDPSLCAELELRPELSSWLWHNGTTRTFLVQALEGRRKSY